MIAQVEPLTRARALRGPFDYRIPGDWEGVGVGSLMVVPFGPRKLNGVVVGLSDTSEVEPERLAEPVRLLELSIPAELVELGLWTAREYASTRARGLALVLPPGLGTGTGMPSISTELVVAATGDEPEGRPLGARQQAVLAALSEGELTMAALAGQTGADRGVVRRLEARGLVRASERERRRAPARQEVGSYPARVSPSAEQAAAIEAAIATIPGEHAGDGEGELLIHGITGSGKTEVYLAAAAVALARGLGVIALVPEIALTPQNVGRFRARLGEGVAVLHSGLTAGERFDEWRRLRSGEARVCVGPRSAIFAPVERLGLVIVDEEHDSSYKQDSDPRYDAREVARERARTSGAGLVIGSATPRVESWHRVRRVSIAIRADGSSLPAVEALDMRGSGGVAGPFHERSRAALVALGKAGDKGMILLNRRGWSPHMECRGCGRAWRCANCDVSLVFHRGQGGGRLRCHHCGASEPVPNECPDCGSVSIARHGVGTEQLERAVGELVAPHPVFRLDADTARRLGHFRVLADFGASDSGVLVGTQMLAKGHDFPGIALGVIVDADSTLRFPDFRSEERTFALVTQLAGRVGRGSEQPGRVLVQTLVPDAEPLAHAARHDAPGFVAAELRRREALRYPPFATLVRVEIGAETDAQAQRVAVEIGERLGPALGPECELLGPAPRFRVRGRSRAQLVVKAPERGAALDPVREVVEAAVAEGRFRGLTLAVDVDPQ